MPKIFKYRAGLRVTLGLAAAERALVQARAKRGSRGAATSDGMHARQEPRKRANTELHTVSREDAP